MGFDYLFFGYYLVGFGSFSWLFIFSCLWSARLYALLCWYFAPTYQPLVLLAPFSYGLQTCVSPISVSSASLVLRRVVILATVGRETVVFRLLPYSGRAYPVFHNRSQHRRDVISLTLFALRSPWKGPLELSPFSVTLCLALRINLLKVCLLFSGFLLGLHIAPLLALVDIHRESVFLSVS